MADDVNRLYVERKIGGRGLKSIEDMYEIRTVGLKKHLYEVPIKEAFVVKSS